MLDNLPDGWTVTPMNGVTTIAKDNMRDLAFTVTGAPSFDDGEVTVTVRITSEDGVTQEDVEITVESARSVLNWNQDLSKSRSNNFADVDPNTLVIVIENSGLRSVQQVTIYVDSSGMSEMNMTLSVPAEGSTDFEFVLPKASQGITRYDVRAEILGDDANYSTNNVDDDFSIEYLVQGSDETSNPIVIVVIIGLTFIILYFGFKASLESVVRWTILIRSKTRLDTREPPIPVGGTWKNYVELNCSPNLGSRRFSLLLIPRPQAMKAGGEQR